MKKLIILSLLVTISFVSSLLFGGGKEEMAMQIGEESEVKEFLGGLGGGASVEEGQPKDFFSGYLSSLRARLSSEIGEKIGGASKKGTNLTILTEYNLTKPEQEVVWDVCKSLGFVSIEFCRLEEYSINIKRDSSGKKDCYGQFGERALSGKRSILRPALWIAGGGLLLGAAYLYQNPEVAEKLQQRSLELYGQYMAPLFAAAREGFGGYASKFTEQIGFYWPFNR